MKKFKEREGAKVNAKRWATYAAAGLATTVGMSATSDSVDADVVTVNPNFALNGGTGGGAGGVAPFYMTFNSGSGNSLLLYHVMFAGSTAGRLNGVGLGNVQIAGFQSAGFAYPSNVPYGANISTLNFGVPTSSRGDMAWGPGYTNSQFINSGTSYVAFTFNTAAGTQYGWAEIVMDNNAPIHSGVLTSYSYTTAGEALAVGQRAIPEPGALGLLALGGIGLATWRRKRSQAA
jgi:hypothetical protein